MIAWLKESFGFGKSPVARTLESIREVAAAQDRATGLAEASADPFANYVDPAGAYRDADGVDWLPVGSSMKGNVSQSPLDFNGFAYEQHLTLAREECRRQLTYSEHAVNGYRNRVHYVVDTGHQYTAAPADGIGEVPPETVKAVQNWLDEWRNENCWFGHQCEFQMRSDIDGEVFRRMFKDQDGILRVEFIEPWQVSNPPDAVGNPNIDFGIECEEGRATRPIRYFVRSEPNGIPQPVDAEEIQHKKFNVHRNVRRGVPLIWHARKNVVRVANTLRNLAARSEVATAHCAQRKPPQGMTATAASTFSTAKGVQKTDSITGDAYAARSYGAGTVSTTNVPLEAINLAEGMEEMVSGLKESLRAIATAFCQPEFMLTSDASNGNYSSTMSAEGPVVRSFKNAQQHMKEADAEIIHEAMEWAEECGLIPKGSCDQIEINIGLPNLITRDEAAEATKNETYARMRILSPQTIAGEIGVEYAQEQANIAEHEKSTGKKWGGQPVATTAGSELDANGNPMPAKPSTDPGSTQQDDEENKRAAIRGQIDAAESIEEAMHLCRKLAESYGA